MRQQAAEKQLAELTQRALAAEKAVAGLKEARLDAEAAAAAAQKAHKVGLRIIPFSKSYSACERPSRGPKRPWRPAQKVGLRIIFPSLETVQVGDANACAEAAAAQKAQDVGPFNLNAIAHYFGCCT